MKLRRPCEHDKYDPHWLAEINSLAEEFCPGGVFLPDNTLDLIGETVQRLVLDITDYALSSDQEQVIATAILDALSVREAEPEVEKNQLEVPFTNEHGAW